MKLVLHIQKNPLGFPVPKGTQVPFPEQVWTIGVVQGVHPAQ